MVTTITRDKLQKHIQNHDNIALVEALPEKYFAEGHLPGAINIPYDEKTDERIAKLLKDKSQTIITYCMNTQCSASEDMAKKLVEMGYKNVLEYVEGKQGWKDAGLKLVTGSKSKAA